MSSVKDDLVCTPNGIQDFISDQAEPTIHDLDRIDMLFGQPRHPGFTSGAKSPYETGRKTDWNFRPDSHVIRYYLHLKNMARLSYS